MSPQFLHTTYMRWEVIWISGHPSVLPTQLNCWQPLNSLTQDCELNIILGQKSFAQKKKKHLLAKSAYFCQLSCAYFSNASIGQRPTFFTPLLDTQEIQLSSPGSLVFSTQQFGGWNVGLGKHPDPQGKSWSCSWNLFSRGTELHQIVPHQHFKRKDSSSFFYFSLKHFFFIFLPNQSPLLYSNFCWISSCSEPLRTAPIM